MLSFLNALQVRFSFLYFKCQPVYVGRDKEAYDFGFPGFQYAPLSRPTKQNQMFFNM